MARKRTPPPQLDLFADVKPAASVPIQAPLLPYRDQFVHVGAPTLTALRPLTDDERLVYPGWDFASLEPGEAVERFWEQAELAGCGQVTVLPADDAIAFRKHPKAYGNLECSHCKQLAPVGQYGAFIWQGTEVRVGT